MTCSTCNVAHAQHELIGGLCHKCTAAELAQAKDQIAYEQDRNANNVAQYSEQLEQAKAESLKWEKGCLANADDVKDCHRRTDNQRLELLCVLAENARLASAIEQIADTKILRGDNPWAAIDVAKQAYKGAGKATLRDLLTPTIELLHDIDDEGSFYPETVKKELARLRELTK